MIHYTGSYTDLYQLTMAQVYFRQGRHREPAVFDYFFRQLPFGNGYAVFAGLDNLLDILENWRFTDEDCRYLKVQGLAPDFVDHLREFQFTGSVRSLAEGQLAFPTEPILQVKAPMLEAQILETILLNVLNFQTLIATKASRMEQMARGNKLLDFGLRRSHGPAGYYASRAAVIGGFDATSHVRAGRDFDLPISGTMAHSFVQSYDSELEAFRQFAAERPHNCILLVDTYDTLHSGVPHAIQVAREMQKRGQQLQGIRLDSGDLAYLARKSRKMLDEAGLPEVKIAASNQLDEYVIRSLMEQNAPIDAFGVGTSLVTGQPDAALDGVYKLAQSGGKPRIKISENRAKVTLPGRKQVYRYYDAEGQLAGADAVSLAQESAPRQMHHPFEAGKQRSLAQHRSKALLEPVMENGRRITSPVSVREISQRRRENLAHLPPEYHRFENPHEYKIGLSPELLRQREELVQSHQKIRT